MTRLSMVHPRSLLTAAGAAFAGLAAAVVTVGTGDYPLGLAALLRTLAGAGSTAETFIVYELRLPRACVALLAGAALALAGAILQALTRNPLGSPDVLGFTQGAATGALVTIVVTGGASAAVAGGAVLGAAGTAALTITLTWRHGAAGHRLVLTGIGLATVLAGVNGFLLTRAQINDAARAMLWLTGSLDGRGWREVVPLAIVIALIAPAVALGGARQLRMLELGDETAGALGVAVRPVRIALLGVVVLLCAAAAAAAGPVSFVALAAPQLARRLTRRPGPNLLASTCLGAALLTGADLAGQRLIEGRMLPVGVLTGVFGGLYLIWLLVAQGRKGRL